MAPRYRTALIALVCAMAVLWVLITPAFDELPSTLPYHFHAVMLPALPVALPAQALVLVALSRIDSFQVFVGRSVRALTCSRLC